VKQVVQDLRNGTVSVEEVPVPTPGPGQVLVRVTASLVSAGTERSAVEFASKNLLQKARARPDLAKQVIGKAKRDGLLTAIETVRSRLGQPQPLGYSNAGTVAALGPGVDDLKVGDPVACAGAGYAVHAEFASVPRNLVTRVPIRATPGTEGPLPLEEAAFATMGAIALHGLHTARVQIGETVAVVGLGLVGLLLMQMVKAAGAHVVGMDPSGERCRLAEQLGCDVAVDNEEQLKAKIPEIGVDAVIITAATKSSRPIELAGEVSRDRGRVVVVGDVGLEVPRSTYYGKELELTVSRSYGPGRYDSNYEEMGNDYPIGYVRWTEGRNMEVFLDLIKTGLVSVQPLITHRIPVAEAPSAYTIISGETHEPHLGVLITYPESGEHERQITVRSSTDEAARQPRSGSVGVGMIGAGGFARSVLIPAIKKVDGLDLAGVCTSSGLTAASAARAFGFGFASSDASELVRNDAIGAVVIATRHASHSALGADALGEHKHTFIEKPLALDEEQLREIVAAAHSSPQAVVMVGYNRRFSPMVQKAKTALEGKGPLLAHYRVNAGPLPADHWIRREGGRLLGELCHFVDTVSFVVGSLPERVYASRIPGGQADEDVVTTIEFADGSVGTITYMVGSDEKLAKEHIEFHGGGTSVVIDDFRQMRVTGANGGDTVKSRLRQDKGHNAEMQAFFDSIRQGGAPPIALESLIAVSLATMRVQEALEQGAPVDVGLDSFLATLA
jgi:predicted dehydrogenase